MYVMFAFAPRPEGGGAFSVASPTIREICGLTPGDVHADVKPLFDRIDPEDRATLQRAIRRATRKQAAWDVEFRYHHPDKGWLWMRAHCTPLVGEDGSAQWHGFINDITPRKREQRELEERNEELRKFAFLIDNSQDFIGMYDLDGRPFFVNEAGLAMVGLDDLGAAIAIDLEDYFFPEDRRRVTEEFLPQVLEEGHATTEIRFRHFATGQPIWMSYSVFTLKDERDQPLGFATISQNIDARKQDEERMVLLIDELNHRVRNTLTIVNSIAAQTLKYAPSAKEFRLAFGGRIAALAKTHTLLAANRWSASTLEAVIAQQLDPYTNGRADALHIEGPKLLVNPKQSLTLSLVFHELAANAAKYGALSVPEGRVEIGWQIDARRQLRLAWRERGGPKVASPQHRGFGSQLIEFNIAHEFDGAAQLDYPPEGLKCRLTIPLRADVDEI